MRIKMLIARLPLIALIASLSLVSTGCLAVAAAGAGLGTAAYLGGDLEVILEAPVTNVGQASTAALNDMNIAVIEDSVSGVDGKIIGRTGGDKRVTIKLDAASENTTKVSIRIGTFGDEELSRLILDNIRENL